MRAACEHLETPGFSEKARLLGLRPLVALESQSVRCVLHARIVVGRIANPSYLVAAAGRARLMDWTARWFAGRRGGTLPPALRSILACILKGELL